MTSAAAVQTAVLIQSLLVSAPVQSLKFSAALNDTASQATTSGRSTATQHSPFEKSAVLVLVKKFAAFYGTRKVHYRAHESAPLVPIPGQKNPSTTLHCTPSRPISAISTHLYLGLLSSPYHSGFPTKILHAFLFSPTRATCRAHQISWISSSVTQRSITKINQKFISTLVTPITITIHKMFYVLGHKTEYKSMQSQFVMSHNASSTLLLMHHALHAGQQSKHTNNG